MVLALALFGCGGHTRANPSGSDTAPTDLELTDPEPTEPELADPELIEPERAALIKVSVSDSSACTLSKDGSIACFELQQGFESARAPVSGKFRDIAGDASAGAALREDGSVATWGDTVPQFPKARFEHIAFDSLSACGIKDDHTIVCNGTAEPQVAALMGNFQQLVVAGGGGVCGVTTEGGVECYAPWENSPLQVLLPPLREIAVDPTGSMGGCGIDLAGALHCWGYYCPIPGTFSHVSLSYFNACATTSNGELQCWNYRLGREDCTSTPSAIKLPDPPKGTFTALASGLTKTCAIEAAGDGVRCW
jgi:hypothetical protein